MATAFGVWITISRTRKWLSRKLGGCCGQMDIQCDDEHLLVAENTKFEVGIYDRDGKRLSGFGQRAAQRVMDSVAAAIR